MPNRGEQVVLAREDQDEAHYLALESSVQATQARQQHKGEVGASSTGHQLRGIAQTQKESTLEPAGTLLSAASVACTWSIDLHASCNQSGTPAIRSHRQEFNVHQQPHTLAASLRVPCCRAEYMCSPTGIVCSIHNSNSLSRACCGPKLSFCSHAGVSFSTCPPQQANALLSSNSDEHTGSPV